MGVKRLFVACARCRYVVHQGFHDVLAYSVVLKRNGEWPFPCRVFYNPLVVAAVVDRKPGKRFNPFKELENLSAFHVCVFPHTNR